MKEKQIQIPVSLFSMLVLYHVFGKKEDEELIKNALEKKLRAVEKHLDYTDSKMASTEEKREEARKRYIEAAGIHSKFQW